MEPRPPPGAAPGKGGEQRNTPLALRIREPTEEERSEVLAERQQEQQQQSTRNGDLLPPVARAIHVTRDSERDSNSTHSTDSTETSIPLPQQTPSAIIKGAVTREDIERLALDALERNDYDLLALITTHAANFNDLDQPGGPRAPGTPIVTSGSAPCNTQLPHRNYRVARASPQPSVLPQSSSQPKPKTLDANLPLSRRRSNSAGMQSNAKVGGWTMDDDEERYSYGEYRGRPSALETGWGRPSEGQYINTEEIESIVKRSNEKLEAETLKMKAELEMRIAQLESQTTWVDRVEPLSNVAACADQNSSHHATSAVKHDLKRDFDRVAQTSSAEQEAAAPAADSANDDFQSTPPLHDNAQKECATNMSSSNSTNARPADDGRASYLKLNGNVFMLSSLFGTPSSSKSYSRRHTENTGHVAGASRDSAKHQDFVDHDPERTSDAIFKHGGKEGSHDVGLLHNPARQQREEEEERDEQSRVQHLQEQRLLEEKRARRKDAEDAEDADGRISPPAILIDASFGANNELEPPEFGKESEIFEQGNNSSISMAEGDQSTLSKLDRVSSAAAAAETYKAHTFASLFTQHAKCNFIDEVQTHNMGQVEVDAAERELIEWREKRYTSKALGCITLQNPLRKRCITLIESKWFDRFIQLIILGSCVEMAVNDPRDTNPKSEAKRICKIFSALFWAIFAFEMVTKIISCGFVRGKGTYIKDNWNRLDFLIVTTGVIEFIEVAGNGSVILRTFRVLRPLRALRAIGRFKDLRMLVELLLGCIPMLVNVFALIAFILFVFGILGVQLFSAGMRGRCYSMQDGYINPKLVRSVCADVRAGTAPGHKSIDGGFNPCPDGESCLRIYFNPMYNYLSFDNIGAAMLIIFQVMLQEDWTPIMYDVWDGSSWWTWTYFIVLNLVGPMFAIQLFLVVVASKYSDAKAVQASIDNAATCIYEVKIGLVSATIESTTFTTLDSYCRVEVEEKYKKTRVINNTVAPVWNEYFVFPVSAQTTFAKIYLYNWQRYGPHQLLGTLMLPVGTLDEAEEGTDKWYEMVSPEGKSVEGGMRIRTQWRRQDSEEWVPLPEMDDEEMYDEDDFEDEERSFFGWIQYYCEEVAYSQELMYVTIAVILFNVCVMAVDFDCDFDALPEYCRQFKRDLERLNLFFTAYFTVELTIKMIGYTPMVYFKETANVFDALIVITSLIELPLNLTMIRCYDTEVIPAVCEEAGAGGMGVLRSFRLMRVLRIGKLVSMFPQIQRQLKVISKTLSTVSSLIALIALLLLIFAILGMSLFGNQSICEIDNEDVDGVAFFRKGAMTRILLPNRSSLETAKIMVYNTTTRVTTIKHFSDDKIEDIPPWNVKDISAGPMSLHLYERVSSGLNGTMIVGLVPRCNFDWFWDSFLTTFQLLTTSDIAVAMYPAMRGAGDWAVLYFILMTVIGNYMMFNLFVAIIITGFSENKAAILKEEKENAIMQEHDSGLVRGLSVSSQGRRSIRGNQSLKGRQSLKRGLSLAPGAVLTLKLRVQSGQSIARGTSISSRGKAPSLKSSGTDSSEGWFQKGVKIFKSKVLGVKEVTAEDLKQVAANHFNSEKGSEFGSQVEEENWHDISFMRKVIENRYWNWFIICIILLSCAPLMMQRPGISELEGNVSIVLNLVCNVVFVLEAIWKIMTYGFKRYIKNSWNKLDFFLVLVSVLDLTGDAIKAALGDQLHPDHPAFAVLSFLKNFRAFRALRPLRLLSRFMLCLLALRPLRLLSRSKGLKIVLGTLGKAVGPVLNTVAIALTCFFVFGIMAVQILGGRMMFCSDVHVLDQEDCVGIDPETGDPRVWLKRQLQYNNIGLAMLSMFVLATQDNWEMHMYAAIDATSKGSGPIANNLPETGIFFLAIIIVASFFVMQLFIGVFIDTFQTVTKERAGLSRNASLQSDNSSATSSGGYEPDSRRRLVVHQVVTMKKFDMMIAAFILGNILAMSAESFKSDSSQEEFLMTMDYIFNFVFGMEVVAKQWGLFPRHYFRSKWNKFDFAVVLVSYFGIAIDNLAEGVTASLNPTILRILRIVRIFRILRAFRIFKAAQGLQNLVKTLLRSLTAVGNLAALLLLLFFVVGVLAVELYGNICVDIFSERNPGQESLLDRCVMMEPKHLIDLHSSWDNLMDAFLTLFRISTSDNWSEIMEACVRQPGRRVGTELERTSGALRLLTLYNTTANQHYLVEARSFFPGCITVEELTSLESILSCRYLDPDTKHCPSTCGSAEFLGYGIFSFFLLASNFILLNLVMAVLMQELGRAMAAAHKKSSSGLSMLMSVSDATSKWIQLTEKSTDGGDSQPDAKANKPGIPPSKESSPPNRQTLASPTRQIGAFP